MIQFPAGYQGDVRIKRYLDFYQAGYGVAMLSSGVAFSPLSLFANGEQGGFYDFSDLSVMFQDAAGTTPVTAVEQPVGRVLDKSGRGNHLSQSTSTARPVLSARVNLLLNTATLTTQSVTTVATTYTLAFSGAGSITLSGTAIGTYSAGSNSITCTAGTLTLTVSGTVTNADLRPSNAGVGLPAYQRVTTATDYDATGFPYYLKLDGTDDFLVSGTISPGSVDKAQVFAGVRKLSDAGFGVVAETSTDPNTVNGTFSVGSSILRTDRQTWGAVTRGSSLCAGGARTYAAPDTRALTAIFDIAGTTAQTEVALRLNGVAQTLAYDGIDNAGTGNYTSQPLYVGARSGGVGLFSGNLYSLILRFSATNLDAATIAATETWVNQKTLAY